MDFAVLSFPRKRESSNHRGQTASKTGEYWIARSSRAMTMCGVIGVLFVLAAAAAGGAAAEPEKAAPPKCETAEINPVTGHVFCIKPLGAPVEAPPEDIAPPCKAEQSRGQWTWAPNCAPQPGEM